MNRFHFICIIILLLPTSMLYSQNEVVDKLNELYDNKDYDKCLKKSISYTENKKYRSESAPYLYASLCNYQLHLENKMNFSDEDYLKDALKYMYKYTKKDPSFEEIGRFEWYPEELKAEALEEGIKLYRNEDYRKAASTFGYITKYDTEAAMVQLWEGLSDSKSGNRGEGDRTMALSMEKIDNSYQPPLSERFSAYEVFSSYAAYMSEIGDNTAAGKGEKLAEKFKEYSADHSELQKHKEDGNSNDNSENDEEKISKSESTSEYSGKIIQIDDESDNDYFNSNEFGKEISLTFGRETFTDNLQYTYAPALGFEVAYTKLYERSTMDYSFAYSNFKTREDTFYYLVGSDNFGMISYTNFLMLKFTYGARWFYDLGKKSQFYFGFDGGYYWTQYDFKSSDLNKSTSASYKVGKGGISPKIGLNYGFSNQFGLRLHIQQHTLIPLASPDVIPPAFESNETINFYFSSRIGVYFRFGN